MAVSYYNLLQLIEKDEHFYACAFNMHLRTRFAFTFPMRTVQQRIDQHNFFLLRRRARIQLGKLVTKCDGLVELICLFRYDL